MARRARMLIASGENPMTAAALAERAGLKSSEYVYRFVHAKREICGKLWKFVEFSKASSDNVDDDSAGNQVAKELAAEVLKAQREAEKIRNVPPIMIYSGHHSASGSDVMPINPYGPGKP